MPIMRLLRQTAAIALCIAAGSGCTKVVEKEVVRYYGVEMDQPSTTTTSTTIPLSEVRPADWDPTPSYSPPHARTEAGAPAWIAAAEQRWTKILDLYNTFVEGQIANSQGESNDCQFAWAQFQAERMLFSPIPSGVGISDAVRQTIELVLGRIESNARICLAGNIGDFGPDRMAKQDQELLQIAQALDAAGADR